MKKGPEVWPPGRDFRWICNIPQESIDKISDMLLSYDPEMRTLGAKLFYQICKVWSNDWAGPNEVYIARVRLLQVIKRREEYDKRHRKENT